MNHNARALGSRDLVLLAQRKGAFLVASGDLPGFQLDGFLCFSGSCRKRLEGESRSLPSLEAN